MIFSSTNGQVCVNLLSNTKNIIENELKSYHPYETGGILIGSYDTNLRLATVFTATRSTSDSKHNLMSFQRGVKGIINSIALAKRDISPNLHYLGEWHSHPSNLPTPSDVDLAQMQLFAKKKVCHITCPLLLIVGGTPSSNLLWEFSLHKYKKPAIYLSAI